MTEQYLELNDALVIEELLDKVIEPYSEDISEYFTLEKDNLYFDWLYQQITKKVKD